MRVLKHGDPCPCPDCAGDAVSEDEAVEAIARALGQPGLSWRSPPIPYDEMEPSVQAHYLNEARVALDAARPYVERETAEKIVKVLREHADKLGDGNYPPCAEADAVDGAADAIEFLFGVSP